GGDRVQRDHTLSAYGGPSRYAGPRPEGRDRREPGQSHRDHNRCVRARRDCRGLSQKGHRGDLGRDLSRALLHGARADHAPLRARRLRPRQLLQVFQHGRLAARLAAAEHAGRARAFCGNMYLTAPSLSQHAGLVALDAREELQGHVETYRRNRQLLLDALPTLGLKRIAPPDGAFYVYADVRHLTSDSLSFCKELLRDTGVATAPGIDFDPLDGRHHIRLSFAVSTAQIKEAIGRLEPWFQGAAGRLAPAQPD